MLDDRRSLTPDRYCNFFHFSCVGTVSPARGPCPSCLALRCPVDLTPSSVCSCQMDKREHMYLLGLWFRLACSLCYPPLTFWTPSACLSKDTKTRACARRQPLWQWQFFFFCYCVALRLLCWTGSVWHLSVTMPSSCVSRQILSELDTWFRRRCQRPQLTHKRAIRPAHCSQSHFVPALVFLSEDMSQRIKASWLRVVETRRVGWYSAWNEIFFLSLFFRGKCLLLMLFS